jgi:hypothetical protein
VANDDACIVQPLREHRAIFDLSHQRRWYAGTRAMASINGPSRVPHAKSRVAHAMFAHERANVARSPRSEMVCITTGVDHGHVNLHVPYRERWSGSPEPEVSHAIVSHMHGRNLHAYRAMFTHSRAVSARACDRATRWAGELVTPGARVSASDATIVHDADQSAWYAACAEPPFVRGNCPSGASALRTGVKKPHDARATRAHARVLPASRCGVR